MENVLISGERIPADIVIISTGILPDVELAENAGLSTGELGGLIVNEHLQAFVNGNFSTYIFAGGDFGRGPATAIEAIADGRIAAISIQRFLNGEMMMDPIKLFDIHLKRCAKYLAICGRVRAAWRRYPGTKYIYCFLFKISLLWRR